jgi:hypothetical protein
MKHIYGDEFKVEAVCHPQHSSAWAFAHHILASAQVSPACTQTAAILGMSLAFFNSTAQAHPERHSTACPAQLEMLKYTPYSLADKYMMPRMMLCSAGI